MAEMHSLLFKKLSDTTKTFDTANNGVVCLDSMPMMSYEAKDVLENDWPDEHGVEIYDSSSLYARLKAQDISFTMGCKGENAVTRYTYFVGWLTTNGILMSVSSEYLGITIKSVKFVKADPEQFYFENGERVLKFKLTLKVTDY